MKFDLSSVLSEEVDVPNVAIIDTEYEQPVIDDLPDEQIEHVYGDDPPLDEIPSGERPKAMPHIHFAENLVGLIDGLQSSLIPMWRKSSLFTAKELSIIDQMDTSGGTAYAEKSTEFLLMIRWKKYLDFAAALPFTEKEKERLIAATERYAATMQITVSPFTGLLMAFGEVAGTRAVLFLAD